jgi:hypothetical protein
MNGASRLPLRALKEINYSMNATKISSRPNGSVTYRDVGF